MIVKQYDWRTRAFMVMIHLYGFAFTSTSTFLSFLFHKDVYSTALTMLFGDASYIMRYLQITCISNAIALTGVQFVYFLRDIYCVNPFA